MKDASYIRTHINVQAVNESKFDVVAYQVGRACERVLAAAQRDPFYFSGDVEIYVSIGPPSPAPKEATMAAETPAAPLERAVERLRDDLKYVNARWVEADAGSDAADVIRSAEELLAALDADPWQTARLEAEAQLKDAEEILRWCAMHPKSGAQRARRYFARREGEKGEPNA